MAPTLHQQEVSSESSAKESMVSKAQSQRTVNKEELPREKGLNGALRNDGQRIYFQRAEPGVARGLMEVLLHHMRGNHHNSYLEEFDNCYGSVIIAYFSFFFLPNGSYPVPTPPLYMAKGGITRGR